MKVNIKRYLRTIMFTILGGIAGYAYYYFVGCSHGTCIISSKPLNATLYMAFMGGLLSCIFDGKAKRRE